MPGKTKILDQLDETALLLPQSLNDALLANDRAKYAFTLLQTAATQAMHPADKAESLRTERQAVRLDNAAFDGVVAGSHRLDDELLHIPLLVEIHALIVESIRRMIAPLALAPTSVAISERTVQHYRERLEHLLAAAPPLEQEQVPRAYIGQLTRGRHGGPDSLHLLVMDLHKDLNALQAGIAEQTIAGASVYGIGDRDRPLIEAFMRGLNRTAPLKFDHPGLGTTATRSGERLIIQNDIGTTDAHVLVIHVEGDEVSITYSDVHVQRTRFFQSLLDQPRFGQSPSDDTDTIWQIRTVQAEGLAGGAGFQLCNGHYRAADAAALEGYLERLGSRLVFLIDWNRARKRLRNFLKKRDCIALLEWAADNDYGHRGFLQLGGEELIFDAIRRASGISVRYGERLDDLLGRDTVYDYLQQVLRTASEGLLGGRSEGLIRDEIKAELLNLFHGAHRRLLDLAMEQAEIIHDLATLVRDGLLRAPVNAHDSALRKAAQRARRLEQRADDLVRRSVDIARGTNPPDALARLVPQADDIADALEDAGFLLGLLGDAELPQGVLQPIRELAELLVEGTRELVKCIADIGLVHRGAAREDVKDFLEAVNRIIAVEHHTDAMEREVTSILIRQANDPRQLHLFVKLATALEEAADALARCAVMLRDYVLTEAMGGA